MIPNPFVQLNRLSISDSFQLSSNFKKEETKPKDIYKNLLSKQPLINNHGLTLQMNFDPTNFSVDDMSVSYN